MRCVVFILIQLQDHPLCIIQYRHTRHIFSEAVDSNVNICFCDWNLMTGNAFSFSWKYISPKKRSVMSIKLICLRQARLFLNLDSDKVPYNCKKHHLYHLFTHIHSCSMTFTVNNGNTNDLSHMVGLYDSLIHKLSIWNLSNIC